MAKVIGQLTDFGFDAMAGHEPRLLFTHTAAGVADSALVFHRKPVEVIPTRSGLFEVELQPSAKVSPAGWYTITVTWIDLPTRIRKAESLPWKLYVPAAGGILTDLLRVPSNPALVWTGAEPPANPSPGSWWMDFDGRLSEFDRGGWNFKQNLRGPAGYNAVGAEASQESIASWIKAPAGPNPVSLALAEGFLDLPAGGWDVAEPANIYTKSPHGIAGWTTPSEVAARALGWTIVTDRRIGAKPDNATNNAAAFALLVALLDNTTRKQSIFFPAGQYMHDGLVIEGKAHFELHGPGELVARTQRVNEYVRIKDCSHFKIAGLSSRHQNPTQRRASPARCFSLDTCTDFEITSCHAHHGEGVGIMLNHCSHGRVSGNKVDHTHADGIGLYGATHHISVVNNTTSYTGDDGIALVGVYTQGAGIHPHDNTITGNTVEFSEARGIVVVGGSNSVVCSNTINDTRAGGIYVSQEAGRQTYGCRDVIVMGNTINRPNTWEPTIIQAGICVYGQEEAYPVESVIVNGNIVRGARVRGIQVGNAAGRGTRQVFVTGNTVQDTAGGAGISAYSVEDLELSGNRVINSATYAYYGSAELRGTITVSNNIARRPNAREGATFAVFGFNEAGEHLASALFTGNTILDAAGAAYGLDIPALALAYGNNTGDLPHRGGTAGAFAVYGNLLLTGSAGRADPAGGRGVMALRNAAVIPASNPSAGGVIYVEAGALKFRGAAGTVTTLAPA